MQNSLFTHFQSQLLGALSFYTPRKKNTIFLLHFFRLLGALIFPHPPADKGVARGKGEIPPPAETEKIVVENGVIFEGSIFRNKFSKK